jgi:hypothetical protein
MSPSMSSDFREATEYATTGCQTACLFRMVRRRPIGYVHSKAGAEIRSRLLVAFSGRGASGEPDCL